MSTVSGFSKAATIKEKHTGIFQILDSLNTNSLKYLQQSDSNSAKKCFKQSLVIAESSTDISLKKKVYANAKEYFRFKHDISNYDFYNEKFVDLIEKENREREKYYLTALIILGFIASSMLVVLFFQKRNNNTIIKQETEANERPILELLEIATQDCQVFYSEFNYQYPDFCSKLLSYSPDLSLKDIETLMYMFFNFTTKEIAIYTNSSFKAIENRKYRIRKKMHFSGDKEVFLWLNEISTEEKFV